MNKKIYLHIGSPKTGTSNLQYFLGENQTQLLNFGFEYAPLINGEYVSKSEQRHNFVYMGNGANLALTMLDEDHPNVVLGDTADFIWQEVTNYLTNTRLEKIIISSEWFFYATNDGLKRFKALADTLGFSIDVFVWLRSQWSLFYSSFAQIIKVNPREYDSIEGYLAHFLSDESEGHYLTSLENFSAIFSKQALSVRVYDRSTLLNGDICQEFLSLIGIDRLSGFDFPQHSINPTPSIEALNFLHTAKAAEPSAYFGGIFSTISANVLQDVTLSKSVISKAIAKKIHTYFESENLEIARRYLQGDQEFEYCEPEHDTELNGQLKDSDASKILLSLVAYLEKELRRVGNIVEQHSVKIEDCQKSLYQNNLQSDANAKPKDTNQKVIVGKNGHLFLGGEDRNQILSQLKGALALDHNDIVTWSWNIQNRKALAEKYGYQILNVICPEPHVYNSQDLPVGSVVSPFRPAAVLLKIFKDDVFYPLNEIRMFAPNPGEAYLRTDSHWSEVGAYAAYIAVMRRLSLEERIIGSNQLVMNASSIIGDLGEKMVPPVSSVKFDLNISDPQARLIYCNHLVNHGHIQHYRNEFGTGRLLIFGTSFSTAWMKFFAESFYEVLYIYTTVSDEFLLENFRPDYVIYETPERFCRTPQSDRIRYPLLYSYMSKSTVLDKNYTYYPAGISEVISALHTEVSCESAELRQFNLPSYEQISSFLKLDPNCWMMLRDSRRNFDWTTILFSMVDQNKISLDVLEALPQTCCISLAMIRVLIRESKLNEARTYVRLHFDSYGYSEEIEWYNNYLSAI